MIWNVPRSIRELPIGMGLALLAVFQHAVLAAPLPDADAFFQPLPEIGTVSRLGKSLRESPASVTVIDRETVLASTFTEIPDLLRLVPGFQVAHTTGATFAAGYHGANDQWPRRFEVMVDGRSVYHNANSSVEWGALGVALDDIERIEVVRGPNGPTFGSNALLGSINIVTRNPYVVDGVHVGAMSGSRDTTRGVARASFALGEMDAYATFQNRRSSGFEGVDDDTDMSDLRFRGSLVSGSGTTLEVFAGVTTGDVGADGRGDAIIPYRERDITSYFQQLHWRHAGDGDGDLTVNASHYYFDNDDTYDLAVSPGLTIPLGFFTATTRRVDLELIHRLDSTESMRFTWGTGLRQDDLKSNLLMTGRGAVDSYSGRLFGSAEWMATDSLLFSLDAMLESHEAYRTRVSPRLAMNWLVSPHGSLRASASRSYRMYTLLERYIDHRLIGSDGNDYGILLQSLDDDYKPERVTSYEIGYNSSAFDGRLAYDLRLFTERLDDPGMGARHPSGFTAWRDQGGRWDVSGFEAQFDFRPMRSTRALLAYTYGDLDGEIGSAIDASGQITRYRELDETIPKQALSLLLTRTFPQAWSASAGLYYVDEVRWIGEGSHVDSFTRVDLKLAKAFRFSDASCELALLVQNLADEDYYEFRQQRSGGLPGNLFERRAFVQLSIDFE